MITQLVAKGLGVGLIPEIALSKERKKLISQIKTDWFDCNFEIYGHQSQASQRNLACRAVMNSVIAIVKNH